MVAVLETKVRDKNYEKVRKSTFGDWDSTNNNSLHSGGHIWVTWNQKKLQVKEISSSA